MRCFIYAIGFMALMAVPSAAQVLGDPNAKAVDAKRDANVKRPGDVGPGAPRANAMFAAMDADSDGVISKVELRKAIKALKTLDTDNDGSITLAEASVGGGPGPGGAVAAGGPLGDDPQIAQLMSMDRNKDGKLTANEVPRDMQQMLGTADQNNDREITRQEIAAAVASARNQFGAGGWQGGPRGPAGRLSNAEQATGQFLQYDKNGDGQLTASELPPQAKGMMQADQNGDGAIDAGELQAAIEKLGGKANALRGGVNPDDARARKNIARDRKAADN
jgi:Ca2+-binding EF-hand superfamily protein